MILATLWGSDMLQGALTSLKIPPSVLGTAHYEKHSV